MAQRPSSPPGEPRPRRGLRPAAIFAAGVVVWGTVAVVAASRWQVIRWALRELPLYLDESFSDPPERLMLLEALERMRDDPHSPSAERLLRRSVEIDPNGEAAYWLAHRAAEEGREEEAVTGFERWLAKNPDDLRAWLDLARIHRRAGRETEARTLLVRARDRFAAEAELHRPRPVPRVGVRFNRKAEEVHAALEAARVTIEAELAESRVSVP